MKSRISLWYFVPLVVIILHSSIDAETTGELRNIPELMPNQENDGEFIELKCTFPWSDYTGRVILRSREERVLTRETFKTFSECMWLVLDNLNITNIGYGTFQDMPILQELDIRNNYIKRIQASMFEGVNDNEFMYLVLPNNSITFIEKETFINLNQLWHLDLSRNPLSRISAETFFGLDGLEVLNLSYTNVTIVQGLFQYIPKLQELRLSGYPFKITANMWEGTGISHLEIAYANITELNREIWRGLENSLEWTLNLEGNSFISIRQYTFTSLSKLRWLKLNNCGIQYIERFAFEGAKQLSIIGLSGNPLISLDEYMFGKTINERPDYWEHYVLYFDANSMKCHPGMCWLYGKMLSGQIELLVGWWPDETKFDDLRPKCENVNQSVWNYFLNDCSMKPKI